MQLSEITGKEIMLRKKQFIGPHPHHDVAATVEQVGQHQVKCRLNDGTIYIPRKYFERADLATGIVQLPTWFTIVSRELIDKLLKESRQ